MAVVHTQFGEFPILGTLHKCRNVKGGWRGMRENGEEVYVRQKAAVARIPEKNRILKVANGKIIGVVLLERA